MNVEEPDYQPKKELSVAGFFGDLLLIALLVAVCVPIATGFCILLMHMWSMTLEFWSCLFEIGVC
jgi:hypothetical protein